MNNIKYILANITWNSNDWKGISNDPSNYGYVRNGNIPHESWNFDFDNERNTEEKIYGFVQFTHPPKVEGNDNLIVFYSNQKIVGFYGKAEVLSEKKQLSENESCNIVGKRDYCVLLKNKIERVKEKGYLEGKERIGRIGFNYIEKNETVSSILSEAIELNNDDKPVLLKIKNWIMENNKQDINSKSKYTPLNQILYGPPGTGKTYNAINHALSIIENKPINYYTDTIDQDERKALFEQYLKKERVKFVTFHQSFSYEDFIEGIKPRLGIDDSIDENNLDSSKEGMIEYEYRKGAFFEINRLAMSAYNSFTSPNINEGIDLKDFQNVNYFKMSLGNTLNSEEEGIYNYCKENNVIGLGWGGDIDFTKAITDQDIKDLFLKESGDNRKFSLQAVKRFKNIMKVGDIVFISNGNNLCRAVGKITGEYKYVKESPIHYHQFRDVKWILKDVSIPVHEIFEKIFSQQTIYSLWTNWVKTDYFKNLESNKPKELEKYVLIIDEINRGNISSILGELITSIEENKRAGKKETININLTYSQEPFEVAPNLYIIGTMNTADRSVEALDTALRRRFSFEEMKPNEDLINSEFKVGDYSLSKILETINKRIEVLLDKDHKIGHSYFMFKDKDDMVSKTREAFNKNIIPLLQEYFYGDYGKIGLVLGTGFIETSNIKKENSINIFAKFDYNDIAELLDNKIIYEIKYHDDDEKFKEAIIQLINNSTKTDAG